MKPFQPLPNDCFDYYPVDPVLAKARYRLWDTFHSTSREYYQRLNAAHALKLPSPFCLLKAEFREAFAAEKMPNTQDTWKGKKSPRFSLEADDLQILAAKLVASTGSRYFQPLLQSVVHSWLNHDRQAYGVTPGDLVSIATDSRDVDPNNLKAPTWHAEDRGLYGARAPSRRLAIRTRCGGLFQDADGHIFQPQDFEGVVSTGDTVHMSGTPERRLGSKIVVVSILPAAYVYAP